MARERVALLGAAGLPWVGDAPGRPGRAPADLDAALAAWFDRYRPEDGWPWLLWVGPTAPLVRGLARLVLAAGVPVARADAGLDAPWRRVVAALDLDALGAGPAARLVHRCADEGLTLVAIARRAPYPDAGEGLEATLGDDVAVALLERAHVLGAGAVPP